MRLSLLDRLDLDTTELTRRGFGWKGNQGGVQHDVVELNQKLYGAIDVSLRSLLRPTDRDIIKSLYTFDGGARMQCLQC